MPTTQGLILVTGKTGSGKSTTLAAMIDDINTRVQGHILTIEDPIEFVHQRKSCLISQREVGHHAPTFSAALHSALREDPDVILVGELRDLETMSIAVTAAEMGILVMGTLHTNGAAQTVDRMVNVFPSDKQSHVRTMLSTSLRGVVSQQLLQRADKQGRVAALEILVNTPATSNLIRQGKLDQLENSMQSGAQFGMRTMDTAIQMLLDQRVDHRQGSLQEGHQQGEVRTGQGPGLSGRRPGSSWRTNRHSVSKPIWASSTVMLSAGLWLMPAPQRTKIMPMSVMLRHGHGIVAGAAGQAQRRAALGRDGRVDLLHQPRRAGRRRGVVQQFDAGLHAAPHTRLRPPRRAYPRPPGGAANPPGRARRW